MCGSKSVTWHRPPNSLDVDLTEPRHVTSFSSLQAETRASAQAVSKVLQAQPSRGASSNWGCLSSALCRQQHFRCCTLGHLNAATQRQAVMFD